MLHLGDCLDVMQGIPDGSVDLTVTSPPYDNLRTYNGNNDQWVEHVWRAVIADLYRVTADGGEAALGSEIGIVEATHKGVLPIGGLQLDCYVLSDGRRVFHKRGMAKALGLKSDGGNAFMKTLGGKKLGSELDEDLWEKIEDPILFKALGSDPAHGYEANVLVDVCKAVDRSERAGKITKAQEPMARQVTNDGRMLGGLGRNAH